MLTFLEMYECLEKQLVQNMTFFCPILWAWFSSFSLLVLVGWITRLLKYINRRTTCLQREKKRLAIMQRQQKPCDLTESIHLGSLITLSNPFFVSFLCVWDTELNFDKPIKLHKRKCLRSKIESWNINAINTVEAFENKS